MDFSEQYPIKGVHKCKKNPTKARKKSLHKRELNTKINTGKLQD